jgi:hypothetical protein
MGENLVCRQKKMAYLCLLAALFAAQSGAGLAMEGQYLVAQEFSLRQKENGIDGTLRLSLDKRLTPKVQGELWGHGEWSFVFPPGSRLYRDFLSLAPAKARLSIADHTGKIIAQRDLDRPLARLERWDPVARGNSLFLLAQDYSQGLGSYSGPVTTLLMVSDSAFHEVKALNTESHQWEQIRLMKSLKSGWRIAQSGPKPEILSVSCHPKGVSHFVVDYTTYMFEGSTWVERKREKDGFWESDDPFPKRSAFP